MTVIDSHQHLWNLEQGSYPWLTADYGVLYRTYAYDELEPQLASNGIDRTLLVQAADSFEDTEAMLSVADAWSRVAGVVAWAPLTDPSAAAGAVERYAADPRVVGIRTLMHTEADPDWVVQDTVLESLGLLPDAGLTFDVVAVIPRHLEHVPTLAARHPSLTIVIDHLAKPRIAAGEFEPWRGLMADAAAHPNVYAKLSGLNTAADFDAWTAADLQPYIDIALELFGPERLMFGGDWPVAVLAGDYTKVVAETRRALSRLTEQEQDMVWGGTAIHAYGLDV
ncbi:MAG: amidohydrolase family protein [Actinomycetes bacterium]